MSFTLKEVRDKWDLASETLRELDRDLYESCDDPVALQVVIDGRPIHGDSKLAEDIPISTVVDKLMLRQGKKAVDILFPEEATVKLLLLLAPDTDDAEEQKLRYALSGLTVLLETQAAWSKRTFGDRERTAGILKHIEKELDEIRANPKDATEWIDVALLAFDGAWRSAGITPSEVALRLIDKVQLVRSRQYPAEGPEDEPIEHIR
jgi:hypothetical protein